MRIIWKKHKAAGTESGLFNVWKRLFREENKSEKVCERRIKVKKYVYMFFEKDRIGLDYVSCSPFRVPIARLSAAQASIQAKEA